ncbi:hypothetical protein [Azospirillum thiophilum]|uniref:hypothetical protein n=1 Tax=Azospirillum thiophilum TaxID=528244 RepID=UPI000B051966|nr:hypothetical protein [Azospirillum thiophilum]
MRPPPINLSTVRAVQTVRIHSKGCHDIVAREYLIRVERRLLAMMDSEGSTIH